MIEAILARLAQAVLVLAIVSACAFAMFRFVGDPVRMMARENATEQEKVELAQNLGLDQPIYIQYAKFMGRLVRGDLGVSFRNQRPVSELLVERFPATFELALVGTLGSLLIGIPLGVFSAIRPDGWASRLAQAISLIGVSTPTFVAGVLMILVFSVALGWLPSFGRGETVQIGGWSTGLLTLSGLKALILPATALAMYQLAMIMRLVRSEMIDILASDYIRYARARGLPKRHIHFRLALRNALMPVVTMTGLQIGSLIAFAIVTETVFQWPGMGLLFIQAVNFADVPVMAAYLVLVGALFVFINATVDLIYVIVDPRLRTRIG